LAVQVDHSARYSPLRTEVFTDARAMLRSCSVEGIRRDGSGGGGGGRGGSSSNSTVTRTTLLSGVKPEAIFSLRAGKKLTERPHGIPTA
jgi:hypothetical protein